MFKKCPDAQVNLFPVNESRLFAIGFGQKSAENGGLLRGSLVHTGGVARSIRAVPTIKNQRLRDYGRKRPPVLPEPALYTPP